MADTQLPPWLYHEIQLCLLFLQNGTKVRKLSFVDLMVSYSIVTSLKIRMLFVKFRWKNSKTNIALREEKKCTSGSRGEPIIKFREDLGKLPPQTLKVIKEENRSSSLSRPLVFKSQKWFSEGRESLIDDYGRGRKPFVNVGTVA